MNAPSNYSGTTHQLSVASKRTLKKRKLRRWLGWGFVGSLALVIALWVAVHQIPWMGPLVANSLRAVIGAEAVTWLEDTAYAIEDRFNRVWKKNEKPKAYWDVKTAKKALNKTPKAPAPAAAAGPPPLPEFALKDVGPVHKAWEAPGDGQWLPIVDSRRPNDEVRLLKTLLHPDKHRSWADLFVVAVDLRRVAVHPMAGYQEPKSDKPEAAAYKRKAKIPESDHADLLAAFNGGFMTEHGHYGMRLDGITFVDPKDKACTLVQYKDDSLGIGPWTALKARESEMLWYRQAPNCMYVDGEMHPLLQAANVRHWGATLDGDTVIRRSAVGMGPDRNTLYVGISNHTNAKVMAEGMRHAGATTVAQLDVNWSYPKFVLYEPKGKDGQLIAVALAEGFEFSEDEYIRNRAMRDFFYLTRKRAPQAQPEKL
ncbi:MAG TPA: hypothetical protein VFU02_00920 [Polyangiaceae bacterium]|nr:hypothetical protein [Polyangiaceae bacterium]